MSQTLEFSLAAPARCRGAMSRRSLTRLHYGACLVALVLVASSADAQSHTRLSSSGRTLGDMIRSLPKTEGGMRRKVISLDSTSDSFIFAAAGSVQGAGGTSSAPM